MLSLFNRKDIVQRVLARGAQSSDSDNDDEEGQDRSHRRKIVDKEEKARKEQEEDEKAKQAIEAFDKLTDDEKKKATLADNAKIVADALAIEEYGYGHPSSYLDSNQVLDKEINPDNQTIRYDMGVSEATVPIFVFEEEGDVASESEDDADITRSRPRPAWRIVESEEKKQRAAKEAAESQAAAVATALAQAEALRVLNGDDDEDEDDDEDDEYEYDDDDDDQPNVDDEEEDDEVKSVNEAERDRVIKELTQVDLDLLRKQLFAQPDPGPRNLDKKKDPLGKKERPPSRIQTSQHLLEFLSKERNLADKEDTFFTELYSILLTRFSIEKSQSAPYINYQDPVSKQSMLLVSVEKGYLDVLELMHDIHPGRVKLHAVDRDGNSALHIACQQGNLPIVRFLVETLNHPYGRHKSNAWTPLMCACAMGHWHIVEYLLYKWTSVKIDYYCKQIGKDASFYTEVCDKVVRTQVEDDLFRQIQNEACPSVYEYNLRYETPLILAANNGFLNVVQIIINYCYRVTRPEIIEDDDALIKYVEDITPSMLYTIGTSQSVNAFNVRFNDGLNTLVKIHKTKTHRRGANSQVIPYIGVQYIDHCNIDGLSALMCAMRYGQLFVVENLISNCAVKSYPTFLFPRKIKKKKRSRRRTKGSNSYNMSGIDTEDISTNYTSHYSNTHTQYSQHSQSYIDGETDMSESRLGSNSAGDDSDDSKFDQSHSQYTHISQSGVSDHDFSQSQSHFGDPSRKNDDQDMSMSKHDFDNDFSAISRIDLTENSHTSKYENNIFDSLTLLEKIAVTAAAEKRNGITAETAENCVAQGNANFEKYHSQYTPLEALRSNDPYLPNVIISDYTGLTPSHVYDRKESNYHYYFKMHLLKMDNLTEVYIKQAESQEQLKCCVMLLQKYQEYWDELANFPSCDYHGTPPDEVLLRSMDLKFKLEYQNMRLHSLTTRRAASMRRQRVNEAMRHQRLAEIAMSNEGGYNQVAVWDVVISRFKVAACLNPQNNIYTHAIRYAEQGLRECKARQKKSAIEKSNY